jgi:ubiquinone biosynthesis protein COQ9
MSEHLLDEKRALLGALLPHVAFDGWTAQALTAAAKDIGVDSGLVSRAFPGGAMEALDFWVRETDQAMIATFEARDGAKLKIRERVALAIMLRFEMAAPQREAVRRAMALAAQPHLAPRFLSQIYRTVDAIWYAAGDTATDFNFYTKRLLLAGVYSSTLLVWLDDKSEGFTATRDFLMRRIDNVMQIQKARGKLEGLVGRLPNPLRLFKRA